ncbi:MAG TPA: hypothetical protein VHW02_12380 [Rhizomicrobium sp.]|nr:hypothetical protein [Rhizomicrobium sp.]
MLKTAIAGTVLGAAVLLGSAANAQQWGQAPQQSGWGNSQQNSWGAQSQPQQATAQGMPLAGAWTTGNPQAGDGATVAFDNNGTYVNVKVGGGLIGREWGHYQATPVSGTQIRIDFHPAGFLPHAVCSNMEGVANNCVPVPVAPPYSAVANFASASSFAVQNDQYQRDPSPALLQVQVADTETKQMAAPQMPVMPTLHPYQTPGGCGPGTVCGMRNDDEHQQPYRVCGVTGGTVYQTRDGVEHCSTQ